MSAISTYDIIVIGSGTCGAAIARDLSKSGAKVLILERGGPPAPNESLLGVTSMADEVKVGNKLTTLRVLATGGSSSMYFGVVNYPPLEAFRTLGVDIAADVDAVRKELPIAPLPESMIGEQSLRLRDAARTLGHDWQPHDMLIDQSRVGTGYSYAALWKAKSYVDEAVRNGATLIERAEVRRILVEGERAVGVEYAHKRFLRPAEVHQVRAGRIVLAAGELASPQILRDSGVPGIGAQGFYCNPGYALYGLVPGMQGRDNFVGNMGCTLEDGIELGDANVSRFMHRILMLSQFKLRHLFAYAQTIGIGVKVKDGSGGGFGTDGGFHKDFSAEDMAKLKKGEAAARQVLARAGATRVFNFGLSVAGRVGGFVRLGEHLDAQLQTRLRNLHVCDGSVIPDAMRGTPTLTLLSLSRYLARHLAAA